MVNTKFEAYKIAREIKRSGRTFSFVRKGVNEFGEPSDEEVEVGTLSGLYHEQNSNIKITTGETTQIRTKKLPMILCLYDEANALNFEVGDILHLNGRILKVVSLLNIQAWNIIGDLSLEEVASDVIKA